MKRRNFLKILGITPAIPFVKAESMPQPEPVLEPMLEPVSEPEPANMGSIECGNGWKRIWYNVGSKCVSMFVKDADHEDGPDVKNLQVEKIDPLYSPYIETARTNLYTGKIKPSLSYIEQSKINVWGLRKKEK